MNILMDIAHPAHVHLLRHTYDELIKKGHHVLVTVKHIPSAIQLLDLFGIPYILLGKKKDSLLGKLFFQLSYNIKLLLLIYKHKVQIGFCSSLTVAQVSKFSNMKSIILDDDDDDVEPLFVKYAHPFSDVILTPNCVTRKSKFAIFYYGYHELAYLHPDYFVPDESVLLDLGLLPSEKYFILRFNAFKAHHDLNETGLSIENKRKLVEMLKLYGKVFITTEYDLEDEFKEFRIKVSADKIHSLLYYATLFIGDSQTMSSEAAVLGTPSIRCNSFAGRCSTLNEEEDKYGLLNSYLPGQSSEMLEKIDELLNTPNLKENYKLKRSKLLLDKINVTDFYVWFIENYPKSVEVMRENPDYQLRFK